MNLQNKKWLSWAMTCTLVLAMIPFTNIAHAVQYQFNAASLELSDSNPSTASDWTLKFTTVQTIPVNGKLVITPEATKFSIPAGLVFGDISLKLGVTAQTLAATPGTGADSAWGVDIVSGTSGSITLTNNDTDTVIAASAITIEIGTNAGGTHQILNPAKVAATGTADIWNVDVTSQDGTSATIDTIDILVATIEHVDIYGSQKPQMTFSVAGQTAPAGGTIGPNFIEWREVTPGVAKTAVMRLKVNTDAKQGFTVYVKQDHNMQHSADATIDIDPIKNTLVGTNAAPVAWAIPAGTTIGVDTGFLGYHTSDATLGVGTADRFTDADTWAGLTATSSEVLYHGHATQSDVDGQDRADVTFKLETNNLQPSGNYANTITFIAKPIF